MHLPRNKESHCSIVRTMEDMIVGNILNNILVAIIIKSLTLARMKICMISHIQKWLCYKEIWHILCQTLSSGRMMGMMKMNRKCQCQHKAKKARDPAIPVH